MDCYPFPDCYPITGGLHYAGRNYNGLHGKGEQLLHYCCRNRATDTAAVLQYVWGDDVPSIRTADNLRSKVNRWLVWHALPIRIERGEYPMPCKVIDSQAGNLELRHEARDRVNFVEHCPAPGQH